MQEFTINAGVLHELLTGALVGTPRREDRRAFMNCLELTYDYGDLQIAGTDGFKLALGIYNMPFNNMRFASAWPVSQIKSILPELKKNKGELATVEESGVIRIGDLVMAIAPAPHTFPNVLSVIPTKFDVPNDYELPALVFNPALLGDLAKIPNTGNRVEIKFAYVGSASLAEWVNDSGVAWRYVFMRMRA